MMLNQVLDFETTGLNPYKGDVIFAYVICGEDLVCDVRRLDYTDTAVNKVNNVKLHHFMYNQHINKIAHNAKFEMGMFAQHNGGVLPPGDWDDTLIMHQVLRNLAKSHKLEILADLYFRKNYPELARRWAFFDKQVQIHKVKQKRLLNNFPKRFKTEILDPMYESEITPLVTNQVNYGLIPVKIMHGYQIADGERGMLLWKLMAPKLKKMEAQYLDYLNEMDLLRTSQKMEQRGMMLSLSQSNKIINELGIELQNVEKEKKKIFGFDINLGSSDHLQKHLFGYVDKKKHENLNHEWKKENPVFNFEPFKYTAKEAPSTDAESIEALQQKYPGSKVFDLLSRHRAYSKGISMIEGYIEKAGDNQIIHPSINTNKAATGRQSVSEPSLQNVSKEVSAKSTYTIPARRCFRPRPGYIYFLGDYSGIEMRMIIDASGEEYLINQLNINDEFDVHSYCATGWYSDKFNASEGSERKLMRMNSKTLGFGRAYGAGPNKIRAVLGCTMREAKEAMSRFEKLCPGIYNFSKSMQEQVHSFGYIDTVFGRRLQVPTELAYRGANYRIQGDAGGVLKRGENNIDNYIMDVHGGDYDKIAQILPVHDEVIIEMHRSLLPKARFILHDLSFCMIDMPEVKVPLSTEWKIATSSWGHTKDFLI